MDKHIIEQLRSIDDVSLLFAVESGSRAWGLESSNSDYDVRYVYHYSTDEYLQLFDTTKNNRSEFDMYNNTEIDYTGWDIYKFLRLVAKSNPTALEWIRSPNVYIDHPIREDLQDITTDFSRYNLFKHYQSLAWSNYQKFIEDRTDASTKRYLYVIRGLINAIYIYSFMKFPPINLLETLSSLQDQKRWEIPVIDDEIREIIKIKKQGYERDRQPISSSLKFWISETFEMLEKVENEIGKRDSRNIDQQRLEDVLRGIIDQ